MVVLSACETLLPSIEDMTDQVNKIARQAGDEEPKKLTEDQLKTLTAGDEIVGLTRAFLYAGTPSVLSSLWSVYSQATADLMVTFYEGLQTGRNKAEALRDAQLQIMQTSGYEHPAYWAAFNLMGDWR
jgi:CHAT domain-containing protein